jgi:3-deoxy-D-manno-octulosonate 8-phosphate phosphatase (KDO 8-P phosphatase)
MDSTLRQRILATRLVVFDFDGVFTDNAVWITQEGVEMVRCSRSDGLGLRLLRELGLPHFVLSTEVNPVVSERCRKLRLRCVQGCEDKGMFLRGEVAERGLDVSTVAYLGNDINDRDCLAMVGLPLVVWDAHPDVVALGRWRTTKPGGHGAVREVCDLIYAVWRQAGQSLGGLESSPPVAG